MDYETIVAVIDFLTQVSYVVCPIIEVAFVLLEVWAFTSLTIEYYHKLRRLIDGC